MTFSVARCLSAFAVTAVCAGASQPLLADETADTIADLKRQLAASLKQIEALGSRINALESSAVPARSAGSNVTASDKPADPPASNTRVDALEQELGQLRDSVARGNQDLGIPLHGFADVGWGSASKSSQTGQQGGASVGTLDFYLTPQIGDHIRSLFEIAFEYGHLDGQIGSDVERGQIGYVFSDDLTVWGGRFHTPYGYWNTAFHHGAQIQTSLTRPTFIDFEDKGGVLPAHSTGIWATGHTGLGSGKFDYDVYVANGSRITGGQIDFNALHDDNSNKAVGGRFAYRFGGSLDGLTLGLHGLTEEVDSYGGVAYQTGLTVPATSNPALSRTTLNMTGAYGVYDADDWEVLSEYYHFGNKDLSGTTGSHSSWAGFLQVGRAITPHWVPYARYEKASFDQTDNYFASLTAGGQSYSRGTLGLRYNIDAKSALKVELNHTKQTDAPTLDSNAIRAQYSIRF